MNHDDTPRMTRTHAVPFNSGLPIACPCQWPSPCHYCQTGHCNQCVHEHHPGAVACETWITDNTGHVIIPDTPVWIVGYACRWECACKRTNHSNAAQGMLL